MKTKFADGKLFCSACREEIGLKRSTIHNHTQSQKLLAGKALVKKKLGREQNITNALEKYNSEEHQCGETLPVQQQVHRVKVVTMLLRMEYLCLRDNPEENTF